MTDQRTLKKIIVEQRKRIEKFKLIAVHVVEHCCTDCEDTTMCEYECAITKLKEALDYQQEKEKKKMSKTKTKNKSKYYCSKRETNCKIKECYYNFKTQYAFNCYKKYCLWREKLDFNL